MIATALAVCRPCSHAVHRGGPSVKATVFSAVSGGIAIAPASGIRGGADIVVIGDTSVSIVQVLRHPCLLTDGDSLVGLAIARVSKSPFDGFSNLTR